jgi:hypothetical protein
MDNTIMHDHGGSMDGYKLASVAGILTMTASVCVQNSVTGLAQVGQTGQTGQREWQPATQPGERPGAAALPGQERAGISTQPMFQLRERSDENKLKDLARELARIETELENSNQRLIRQLSQVRLLDGDRKVDELAQVVQGMLQDHVQLHNYLNDLREVVTGRVGTAAVLPAIEPKDDEDEDDDGMVDPLPEPEDEPDSPTYPPS